MKKFLTLLLALAMTLSLAACGSDSTEETEGTDRTEAETVDYTAMSDDELKAAITTVSEGTLTVATSPDFAPYEFYAIGEDGQATLAGFEMSLAQYIADYLGLELEVVPMDFDGTLMELQNKSVDLGMAGYSPKPERENIMDFSDIFYTGGQSFVTTQDKADLFTSLEDTNKVEYSIGAQTGSIQVDLAQTNSPDAELIQLPKVTDVITDLLAGNLDGAYIETVVAETYAKNYPELNVLLDVPYEQEGSVVGVSMGNTALLEGVNRAIAAALEDGTMDEFITQANELASGETYEGLLDENGQVAETPAEG
ncbi:transporter substrate-binding domain-containing protein [Dysosmobacter sp.]|uniref:transporter substrate-binding domain-containing protein n=1 Tax=Dysosmobacter sp. TaxID=2591382 RepID=UPI002634D9F6|nr:transporter substrate-binding domain-containing protein [Dysosmobacter sp.]